MAFRIAATRIAADIKMYTKPAAEKAAPMVNISVSENFLHMPFNRANMTQINKTMDVIVERLNQIPELIEKFNPETMKKDFVEYFKGIKIVNGKEIKIHEPFMDAKGKLTKDGIGYVSNYMLPNYKLPRHSTLGEYSDAVVKNIKEYFNEGSINKTNKLPIRNQHRIPSYAKSKGKPLIEENMHNILKVIDRITKRINKNPEVIEKFDSKKMKKSMIKYFERSEKNKTEVEELFIYTDNKLSQEGKNYVKDYLLPDYGLHAKATANQFESAVVNKIKKYFAPTSEQTANAKDKIKIDNNYVKKSKKQIEIWNSISMN